MQPKRRAFCKICRRISHQLTGNIDESTLLRNHFLSDEAYAQLDREEKHRYHQTLPTLRYGCCVPVGKYGFKGEIRTNKDTGEVKICTEIHSMDSEETWQDYPLHLINQKYKVKNIEAIAFRDSDPGNCHFSNLIVVDKTTQIQVFPEWDKQDLEMHLIPKILVRRVVHRPGLCPLCRRLSYNPTGYMWPPAYTDLIYPCCQKSPEAGQQRLYKCHPSNGIPYTMIDGFWRPLVTTTLSRPPTRLEVVKYRDGDKGNVNRDNLVIVKRAGFRRSGLS